MRIWLSSYQLISRHSGDSRWGFLLKVEEPNEYLGYADIFPWPEFGDPDVKDIPSLIKQGSRPPILQRSFAMAKLDGLARAQNIGLLQGKRLRNHFLLTELNKNSVDMVERAIDEGFKTLKLKVMREPQVELNFLESIQSLPIKVRLDANGRGDLAWFEKLRVMNLKIDWIEDPFYETEKWKGLGLPCAYDQVEQVPAQGDFQYRVIKPAKQVVQDDFHVPVIFTSYLDHPIGVAHAFYQAFTHGKQTHDYGLLSHQVYEDNIFLSSLIVEGPHLSYHNDFGIGFTEQLNLQKWQVIQ